MTCAWRRCFSKYSCACAEGGGRRHVSEQARPAWQLLSCSLPRQQPLLHQPLAAYLASVRDLHVYRRHHDLERLLDLRRKAGRLFV